MPAMVGERIEEGFAALTLEADARGGFEVGGREVDLTLPDLPLKRDENGLPMHGLLSAAPGWRVARHVELDGGGALAASFDFGAYPHLLAAFPFPHLVEIEA